MSEETEDMKVVWYCSPIDVSEGIRRAAEQFSHPVLPVHPRRDMRKVVVGGRYMRAGDELFLPNGVRFKVLRVSAIMMSFEILTGPLVASVETVLDDSGAAEALEQKARRAP